MKTLVAGEQPPADPAHSKEASRTVLPVLFALSFSHLLNDTIQSSIAALYPLLKQTFDLSFTRIGLITLTCQLTASLLQPVVGHYTDRRPLPLLLPASLAFTFLGLVLLSLAGSFGAILVAVACVGIGSATFHPEASRMAYMAAGKRRGFAQSFFQMGGNVGTSLGPLLAVLILVQFQIAWFTLLALAGITVLSLISHRYGGKLLDARRRSHAQRHLHRPPFSRKKIAATMAVLLALIFAKYFYITSLGSYFTFYLIDKFHVSVQTAQIHLFVFLFSVAAGTLLGGPLADRFGRKSVIWGSLLGAAPFTLLLPHANLFWTGILSVPIGLILASAFTVILVYAQELTPGREGVIAGLFFGFAFGVGGIGSAILGKVADQTSIQFVFRMCAYLPLLGVLTALLPSHDSHRKTPAKGKDASFDL